MSTIVASLATRRVAIVALALALVAAIGVAVFNDRGMFGRAPGDSDVAGAVRNGVQQGVNGIKAVGDTVASLFGSRSPGERAAGLQANLKHKRQAALHQRALPKMRHPVNPLAGIVGAVPTPPPPVEAPVIAQPLDKVLNAPPGPVAISPPVGGGGGGGGFPGVFIPGGGGGGIIIPPPAVNPPVTPPITPPVVVPPVVIPPTTSGVPEPSAWAMMLMGFLLMGGALRQQRRLATL